MIEWIPSPLPLKGRSSTTPRTTVSRSDASERGGKRIEPPPPPAVVWANRAACSLRLEKYNLAYWDARMSRSIDDKYVKGWWREGEALKHMGRFEDAAQVLYEGYMHNQDDMDLAMSIKDAIEQARKQVQR